MNITSLLNKDDGLSTLQAIHRLKNDGDAVIFLLLLRTYLEDLREQNDGERNFAEIRIRQGKIQMAKEILDIFDKASSLIEDMQQQDEKQKQSYS